MEIGREVGKHSGRFITAEIQLSLEVVLHFPNIYYISIVSITSRNHGIKAKNV